MAGFDIFQNNFGNVLANATTRGEHITIEGRVLDGTGTPVRDAMLEIWQANADGRYNHPADNQNKPVDPEFRGWGRTGAHFQSGLYTFDTVKPGSVAGRHTRKMAPHINVWIVSRGINIGLHTRLYFSDEAEANAADPVLNLIEWEVRRKTLIGKREVRKGTPVYRFDIHLQGPDETVFFDV